MDGIIEKFQTIWNYLIIKGGLFLTIILTVFTSSIGYPKQVINFIIILMIIDIVSKWISIVTVNYGSFTLLYFFKAWKEKVLNSKKLKHGLFIKIFFYTIFLYIAHQMSITTELAWGGIASSFLYNILIVLDCISICENAIEAGFDRVKPILQFFNRQRNKLMEKDIESTNIKEVNLPSQNNENEYNDESVG